MSNKRKPPYDLWKTWAWRFVRTSVAGGAGSVVSVMVILKPDLSNAKVYSMALVSAFIAGALSAGMLALRDNFGDTKKSEGIINKLPV